MRRVNFATSITTAFLFTAISALPPTCRAADRNNSSPAPVAYVYTGSSISHGNLYYSFLTGFAVAADGSAQALPSFPLNGAISMLTPTTGHIFAVDSNMGGRNVVTYTLGSDGSLAQTAMLDVANYFAGGDYMTIYALNPDRAGRFFNIVMSCGSCNSAIAPFRIGADGTLSLSGLVQGGGAKVSGVYTFSPDNRYAYTLGYGGPLAHEKLQQNGMLTFVDDLWPLPPAPPWDNICLPGDMAASSQGYMAIPWWGEQYWCGQYSDGYELANYKVTTAGELDLVAGSELIPPVEEYAVAFDPTGTYLAVAGGIGFNQPPQQAAIQIYKLQSDGTLAAVGAPVNVPGLRVLDSVAWDNSNHLYAAGSAYYGGCDGTCGLYIFNSNDGVLTPAPDSPHVVDGIVNFAVLPTQ